MMKPTKQKLPRRIKTYLREQQAFCKASTIGCYRVSLGCFVRWIGEINGDLTKLTKPLLRNYPAWLNDKKLAPYTRVNYLLSVKKYLAWEIGRGEVPGGGKLNPDILETLDRKHLPKVPEYLPKPLSSENDRLLQEMWRRSENPYAPLFLLLRQTGLRISELIDLPPDCILTGGKNEKYLKIPLGKMNNERLVPLTEESLRLIEKIKNTPSIKTCPSNKNRLIGRKGSVSKIYHHLDRRFRKLLPEMTDQNKPITFHRLRHTYATSLLTGGVSLISLMKLLGHRRIEMTLRYAKVTPTHLRNEYLKAVNVLQNQTGIAETIKPDETAENPHPTQFLRKVSALVGNTNIAPPCRKKNLLLKLSRIQNELSKITFPKKLKTNPSRENHMSRWAG